MTDISSEAFRYLSEQDVSEETAEKVLNQLRQVPGFERFSPDDWNRLRDKRPNLFNFIAASIVEVEPDDPIKREKIAAAFLGLVVLEDEIDQQKGEERIAQHIEEMFGAEITELFIEPGSPAA